MNRFKIIALTEEFASQIRAAKVDSFGNKIVDQVATGLGPCRVSLKPFKPGIDKRILMSYSPFQIDNAFNQSGPIFIYEKKVATYKNVYVFPLEIKADKENFPLSLIGYSEDQRMIFTKMVGDEDVDLLIPQIFEKHHDVAFMHARNSEAGCYICKIERA